MKKRYKELDALRGVACLIVVLFHYTVRYHVIYPGGPAPFFELPLGSTGVKMFFILSGFVIFMTLDKRPNAADFAVARFSRLYPAYWACLLITFAAVLLFSLPGRQVSPIAAAVNLTMLQKWFRVPHVDGVYWSLSVELVFYAGMLVFSLTGLLKWIERIAWVWLALIILAGGASAAGIFHLPDAVSFMLLLNYGHLFIAGITLYRMMEEKATWPYAVLAGVIAAEFVLHGTMMGAVIAVYILLFWLFVKGKLGWLAIGPLLFLGQISYSLYLLHQNIGYIVIRELQAAGLATPVSMILAPLLVSVGLAFLVYKFVEMPSLKGLRRLWQESAMRRRLGPGRAAV